MPWTAADAKDHVKGLSSKQATQWAAVANAALKSCQDDGKDDCDASAIRQANAAVKKAAASEAIGEAATVRHRAGKLARDLDALLADKGLADEARAPLLSLRADLSRTWGEILGTVSPGVTESDGPLIHPELARLILEAEDVLASDDSWDGRRTLVQQALCQQYARDNSSGDGYGYGYGYGSGPLPYIEAMYDDTVVYCCDGCIYACSYTIGADDAVALGDPTEVERAYVPVSMTGGAAATEGGTGSATGATEASSSPEASPARKSKRKKKPGSAPYRHAAYASDRTEAGRPIDLRSTSIPLIEAKIGPGGTVPIKIIAPGWGSSGYYAPDVLERDGPTVFPSGTHMYLDHPTIEEDRMRPERSVKDLAAVLVSDPVYHAEHKDGPGLYSQAQVFEPFRTAIGELAPYIGVSIRAHGTASDGEAEGRAGPVVERLTDGLSVDFVTAAGAGGRVLEIVESARRRTVSEAAAGRPEIRLDQEINPIPSPDRGATEGGSQVNEEQAKALREASEKTAAELTETRARLARMEEGQILREARDIASSTLASIRMPDMTRDRLMGSIALNPPLVEGEHGRAIDRAAFVERVRKAAGEELAYLAGTTGLGSGAVVGMGGAPAHELTEADLDKQREAAFASFLGSEKLGKIAAHVEH